MQAFLGTAISLIYNNTHTLAVDNSGLPMNRFVGLEKDNVKMTNILWKDHFYVLLDINKVYEYSNGLLKYSSMMITNNSIPLAMVNIKYSQLVVFADSLYSYHEPNQFDKIQSGNFTPNIQCYKSYE
jgi:hypothetical protein